MSLKNSSSRRDRDERVLDLIKFDRSRLDEIVKSLTPPPSLKDVHGQPCLSKRRWEELGFTVNDGATIVGRSHYGGSPTPIIRQCDVTYSQQVRPPTPPGGPGWTTLVTPLPNGFGFSMYGRQP